MTLHEAIAKAIKGMGGGEQHVQDITEFIKRNRLYIRKDGDAPARKQVSADIAKYPELFSRNDGYIWLNE